MTENYSRNNVAKNVMQKLFLSKSDDSDLLIQFCRVLAHVHIKLYVYSIIIQTLESIMPRYRIKENEVSKSKTIYTLIRDPSKYKIVEIEVVGNEVFSTAYNLLCFANFIPVVPRAKVMIREISDLIKSTISVQDAYLALLRSW